MSATKVKREALYHTHEFLWSDLEDVVNLFGERRNTPRGLYTAGLVLTYACLEAHLNFLGEILFPDVWSQGRKKFGRSPYRGTLGKLAFLASELGVTIEPGRKPYSTLCKLETRRHKIIHARLESLEHRLEVTDPRELQPLQSGYDVLVSPRFIRAARLAVEEMGNRLQKAAFLKFPSKIFGELAFSGVLGSFGYSVEP